MEPRGGILNQHRGISRDDNTLNTDDRHILMKRSRQRSSSDPMSSSSFHNIRKRAMIKESSDTNGESEPPPRGQINRTTSLSSKALLEIINDSKVREVPMMAQNSLQDQELDAKGEVDIQDVDLEHCLSLFRQMSSRDKNVIEEGGRALPSAPLLPNTAFASHSNFQPSSVQYSSYPTPHGTIIPPSGHHTIQFDYNNRPYHSPLNSSYNHIGNVQYNSQHPYPSPNVYSYAPVNNSVYLDTSQNASVPPGNYEAPESYSAPSYSYGTAVPPYGFAPSNLDTFQSVYDPNATAYNGAAGYPADLSAHIDYRSTSKALEKMQISKTQLSTPPLPAQKKEKNMDRAANRGNYHCGRCGMLKANHVCAFTDAPPAAEKEVQTGLILKSVSPWEGFEGETFIQVKFSKSSAPK